MPKDCHVQVTGIISNVYPGGSFQVQLDSGMLVNAQICGKMRKNRIRVILGDKVDVALSPYDLTHGIVTFRHK